MNFVRTHASLNRKIATLFVVLGLALGLGGYGALKTTVFPSFVEFELQSAELTNARTLEFFDTALNGLRIMNIEYSIWDQTYDFAIGRRPEYVRENMDPAYWHSVDTHLMLIFDDEGNRLSGSLTRPADGKAVALDSAFNSPLMPDHPLVRPGSAEEPVRGLIETSVGPMLVVSHPILRSDGSGPVAGSLVTGQVLTDDVLAEFARRVGAGIRLHPVGSTDIPDRIAASLSGTTAEDGVFHTDVREAGIHAFRTLRDVQDRPLGVLEIVSPREISGIGAATIRAAGWTLGAAGAFFLFTGLLFMNRSIIAPIRQLTEKILRIRETGDLSIEIADYGSDEVGLLADEFRALTKQLDVARRDLESARDEALEVARTKSEFLARMSHEIRTPMNGVLGMTELLRDTPLNPKQQRFARTIHDSAMSLLSIINDILDFSKIESGKMRLERIDVDLRNLLEETIESVATSAAVKGIELINLARLDLSTAVRTDPGRLRQVLTNLLGNAIKFTDEGEVVLIASSSEDEQNRIRIDFEVRDTGIGIRPEKQKVIFESFMQEDGSTSRVYGGTGLGLAICQQLIGMMGGRLDVTSTPGQGSTFSFSLLMDKGATLEVCERSRGAPLSGCRILVVDDNETNLEILGRQLSGWRALTGTAVSGRDGLEALASAHSAGTPYDLAILDIHMPGMDGLELAEAIRADDRYAGLKLVILSSVSESIPDEQIAALDIAGQLAKPVRQSDLYDALAIVLAGEEAGASHSRSKVRAVRSLSGTVLLAEDNAVNRMVAAGMLESMGLQVVMAKDGNEAVRRAADSGVDLVLMDCQMPETDGFTATRQIREREAAGGLERLPIVALTANALKGDRQRCLEAGMDEYLSKPFTSEQLHSVLSLLLGVSAGDHAATGPVGIERDAMAPSREKPPVDHKVLEALSEFQQAGDDDFVASIVDAFCESAEESRDRMSQAIAAGDASRIADIAHALKSSSGNVGANLLASVCTQLEILSRNDHLSGISQLHERFERELARVLDDLRQQYGSVTA